MFEGESWHKSKVVPWWLVRIPKQHLYIFKCMAAYNDPLLYDLHKLFFFLKKIKIVVQPFKYILMCMCGHLTVLFFITDNREKGWTRKAWSNWLWKTTRWSTGRPGEWWHLTLGKQQLMLPWAFFAYFYLWLYHVGWCYWLF